ncbi:unnamed protein product [Lepeophtheirus salmonis]|uniref:(salmon louse) hypothetical protein n=1 Tax=Lepeophtheirus salmonis TaxID=72036 RepID=A0A7R8CQD3_LEPSM|nr:unnamed protein product [Lepeophtheirus salmonis]CAF2846573.1 unnamed protein product [Lepeophtheirus salmonis]
MKEELWAGLPDEVVPLGGTHLGNSTLHIILVHSLDALTIIGPSRSLACDLIDFIGAAMALNIGAMAAPIKSIRSHAKDLNVSKDKVKKNHPKGVWEVSVDEEKVLSHRSHKVQTSSKLLKIAQEF